MNRKLWGTALWLLTLLLANPKEGPCRFCRRTALGQGVNVGSDGLCPGCRASTKLGKVRPMSFEARCNACKAKLAPAFNGYECPNGCDAGWFASEGGSG